MNCPICQKPAAPDYRPFCCKRCADLDLGKWLTGAYAIPSQSDDDATIEIVTEPPEKPH
jgi:endogenous inhibitor of DNA gyrase (YacG/DUF329 family)